MTGRDWLTVLSALVLRAMTAPVVLARIAVFETQHAAEMIAMERSRMLLETDSLPPGLIGVPDVVLRESTRSVADTSSDYAHDELDDDDEEGTPYYNAGEEPELLDTRTKQREEGED